MSQLGLEWGESDGNYPGLEIGRRYFSRLPSYEFQGGIGQGWYHSLQERLVAFEEQSLDPGVSTVPERMAHLTWDSPFVDPDHAFIKQSGVDEWDGPAFLSASIETVTSTAYPAAKYVLINKDKTRHYFDEEGRILARENRSGLDAVVFEYLGTNGILSKVIDQRGQEFTIGSDPTGTWMTSITDPTGHTINYTVDTTHDCLDEVVYPPTATHENGYGSQGEPQGSTWGSTLQSSKRIFSYDAFGKLSEIKGDDGVLRMAFLYEAANTAVPGGDPTKVWRTIDSEAEEWIFETNVSTNSRLVTTPRGFQREYFLDTDNTVLETRQYYNSVIAGVPERQSTGHYSWTFERNTGCDCGLLTAIIEPDGGRTEITYNARYDVRGIKQIMSDGSGNSRNWLWTYDSDGRVKNYTDPRGPSFRYTFTYTDLGASDPIAPNGTRIVRSNNAGGIRPLPSEWTWTYDDRDRLVQYTGPSNDGVGPGHFERYEYYGASAGLYSKLRKKTYTSSDLARWTEFTYDASGRLLSGTTNHGVRFDQEWNARGQLVRWKGPDKVSQQYVVEQAFDDERRVTSQRYRYYAGSPSGSGSDPYTWVYTNLWYDRKDQVLFYAEDVEPGVAALSSYEYDANGNMEKEVGPDGLEIQHLYDEQDFEWIDTRAPGTSLEKVTKFTYRPDGEVVLTETPFDDNRTDRLVFAYDGYDRLESMELRSSTRVTFQYDAGDRIILTELYDITGSSPVLLSWEQGSYLDWHDSATSYTRHIYEAQSSTEIRAVTSTVDYGPSGLALNYTVGGRLFAEFEYEDDGRVKRIFDGAGNEELMSYSSTTGFLENYTIKQAKPDGSVGLTLGRQFIRDVSGRATSVVFSGTGETPITEIFEYDSFDQVVKHVDSDGVIEETDYGYDGRVLEKRMAVDAQTSVPLSTHVSTYTPAGRYQTLTDNRNNTVTWAYDDLLRVHREIQPDATYWEWNYNEGGFLTSSQTPTGKSLVYQYGQGGVKHAWPTGRLIYDPLGALLRTDSYDWFPTGSLREAAKTETIGGVQKLSTVTFSRDSDGLPLTETTDGQTVTYSRDGLGRASYMFLPGSIRLYQYDDFDRVTSLMDNLGNTIGSFDYLGPGRAMHDYAYGDGSTTTIARTGFGRVESMTALSANQSAITSHAYDWTGVGLLKYEHRLVEGEGDVYQYDDLRQLKSFVRGTVDPIAEYSTPGSTVHESTVDYALDADNHRSTVTETPYLGVPGATAYTVHPDRHHYTSVGGDTRVMSLDGNLIASGNVTYDYDATDNLVAIWDSGALVAAYEYDALGRRSSKTVGTTKTTFVNAGPWAVEEYISVNGALPTLDAVNFHVQGLDDVIMTRRVDHQDVDRDGDTTEMLDFYLHKNQLGCTTEVTINGGLVVERYRYDAYGTPRIEDSVGNVLSAPKTGNRFLFTGREYDVESGFYHYRARTYDPSTGVFLQEDPLGLVDGVNPVAYVGANPITLTDPMGMASVGEAVKALSDFIKANGDLVVDLVLDLFAPLGALIDAIAAATGYDVRAMLKNGFSKVVEMGWWDRIKSGASALVSVGGAVAVIAKLDKILDKLKKLARAAKNGAGRAARSGGQKLKRATNTACFVAGTLVQLASGSALPIEEVELGQVVTSSIEQELMLKEHQWAPADADFYEEIDEGRWRTVYLVLPGEEGRETRVSLLRPLDWIRGRNAEVGREIFLDYPELKISGWARVSRIGPCPSIPEQGPGARPVVAKYSRTAPSTVRIRLVGLDQPLEATPNHPLFSHTRKTWVGAGQVVRGEWLRTGGAALARVESLEWSSEVAQVYNLEVHRGHTYCVSPLGVLAHNNHVPGGAGKKAQDLLSGKLKREFPSQHLDKSLVEIKEALKKASGLEQKDLKKAKKLLEQQSRLRDKLR